MDKRKQNKQTRDTLLRGQPRFVADLDRAAREAQREKSRRAFQARNQGGRDAS